MGKVVEVPGKITCVLIVRKASRPVDKWEARKVAGWTAIVWNIRAPILRLQHLAYRDILG